MDLEKDGALDRAQFMLWMLNVLSYYRMCSLRIECVLLL